VTDSGSKLPDEVLGHLQETLLRSVLSREALPGGTRPVEMPDLSFVLRQSTVLLSNDNLASSVSLEALPVPARVLSLEDIVKEAQERGDVAYLRFQPALEEGNAIRVTLEAKIIPQDARQHALGLSGVQVKFANADGRWMTVDEPRFFAT
jgi:hypothetical protein